MTWVKWTGRAAYPVAALALWVGVALADEKPSPSDAAAAAAADDEAGFVKLFNGKDLAGWVYGKGGALKSGKGYQLDEANGVLYCTKEDGGNLYTEKEYKDFVLRFDFKLTPNANDGVGIRAPLDGDSAYQGMEIQV